MLVQTYHPPHPVLQRYDHELANINFTINGSFTEISGRRPQEATDSSVLVKPTGEQHANLYSETLGFVIELLPDKLQTVRRFSKLLDVPAHNRGGLPPAFIKKGVTIASIFGSHLGTLIGFWLRPRILIYSNTLLYLREVATYLIFFAVGYFAFAALFAGWYWSIWKISPLDSFNQHFL